MAEEKVKGKRGVRLNKLHQQSVKDKIQGAYLINRLMKHVDGDLELTSTQVDGIKFLLNKLISNAPVEQIIDSSTEHSGSVTIEWMK